MKIAITSDIHNNLVNLKKVLDYCKKEKIKTIVCCGDVASKETLDFFADNFLGQILLTFGNAEYDDLRDLGEAEKYKNVFIFPKFGEANLEKRPVAFSHFPDRAKELARTGKYTHVFYGHTHKPWSTSAKASDGQGSQCILINPGTTAGEIYPPTFAVWETDKDNFKLIRIHDLK